MKRINEIGRAFLAALLAPLAAWFERTWILSAVTLNDFRQGRVVIPGQEEAIDWNFYDFQLYPAAGQQQFDFFQLPQGQGVTSAPGAVVGSPKALQDTNMQLQGQMPRYLDFLVRSLEIYFFPGSSAVASTFAVDNPAAVHADPIVIGDVNQINDVNTIAMSGAVILKATDKEYVREGPLLRFPPKCHLGIGASLTAVAGSVGEVAYADRFGEPRFINPNITLTANQNFVVSVVFPSAIATPSTFNGRIGCVLGGVLKRAAQ